MVMSQKLIRFLINNYIFDKKNHGCKIMYIPAIEAVEYPE